MGILLAVTLLLSRLQESLAQNSTQANGIGETAASPSSAAGVEYFKSEMFQLTDAAIDQYPSSVFGQQPVLTFATKEREGVYKAAKCKATPADQTWAPRDFWTAFNESLGGALITGVPLAAPCYDSWPSVQNDTTCADVKQRWSEPWIVVDHPTATFFPGFQGRTCLLPTSANSTCTLGSYPNFVVNVSTVAQVQLAVNFARNTNTRLIVKNKGHDFNGNSVGAGALSIWTHHLKDIKFYSEYSYGSYKGPAFKVGAGVATVDIYNAAHGYGVSVVGGQCRTVGLAGGYTAGGGHSMLMGLFGLGADQVLSMEVVLPSGRFVSASDKENPDLFWALRGGGPSTFGVVTSMVIKAHPKLTVSSLTFNYTTSSALSDEAFWSSARAYFKYVVPHADRGLNTYFAISATNRSALTFSFLPLWAPNMTIPQLQEFLSPYLADLKAHNISIQPDYRQFDNVRDAWVDRFPRLETPNRFISRVASRFFPRDAFAADAFDRTFEGIKAGILGGGRMLAYGIRGSPPGGYPDSAVHPGWRDAVLFAMMGTSWPEGASDAQIANQSLALTNEHMKFWRDVTPGAGTYMNEADINEVDWQQTFFGRNYEKLLEIKRKYDPEEVFVNYHTVGSDSWVIMDQLKGIPTSNGKLCRK